MGLSAVHAACRQFVRDWPYALVVIVSLSVALAMDILAIAYARLNLGVDDDISSTVVRLEQKIGFPGAPQGWLDATPLPLKDNWTLMRAPVESSSRLFVAPKSVRAGGVLIRQTIGFVDPEFPQIFGSVAVSGDPGGALGKPDTIVLGVRSAQALFGSSDVVGRAVFIDGLTYTVGAVIGDRPSGSTIAVDALMNIKARAMPEAFRLTSWLNLRGQNFMRLAKPVDASKVASMAEVFFTQTPEYEKLPDAYKSGPSKAFGARAVPVQDLRLSGAGSDRNRRLLLGLSIATGLVNLLAVFNFVNLMVVRTLGRQREIAMRKALGASRTSVAIHMVIESVTILLLASVLALPLVALVVPAFSSWFDQPIGTAAILLPSIACLPVVAVLLGGVAGVYPACIAWRVQPARALAGREAGDSVAGLWLRRGITSVQFAAAIALVAATIVIVVQSRHAANTDPGFDAASLLAIDAPVDMEDQRLLALRDALARLPNVVSVGLSNDVLGRGRLIANVATRNVKGDSVPIAYEVIGPNFFQTYDVKPIAGRLFDPLNDVQAENHFILLNEMAISYLGYANPAAAVGQRISDDLGSIQIIGVVPNFHRRGLREALRPTIYSTGNTEIRTLTVRTMDPAKTIADITNTWPLYFPDDVLMMDRVKRYLDAHYEDDRRLGVMISIVSAIGLILAGLGVYSVTAYAVRKKSREIALRKLFGATPIDVARLLAREVGALLLVGAALGLPVGAWVAEKYLSEFTSRADVLGWALAASVTVAAIVAGIATARHARTALRTRAADALRAA